jgi:hypothetical protein
MLPLCDGQDIMVQCPVGARVLFSPAQHPDWLMQPLIQCTQGVKWLQHEATTHFQLILMLRLHGSIPPLLCTFSVCST